MSSVPRNNKPPKGSMSQLFFFFLNDLYLSKYIHYVHIILQECLLPIGLGGGSAGQPRPALDGKALSQPKPHPSDRIV